MILKGLADDFALSPTVFVIYRSGITYNLTNDTFGILIMEQTEIQELFLRILAISTIQQQLPVVEFVLGRPTLPPWL